MVEKLSVIIPTTHPGFLGEVLHGLSEQNDNDFEVIVVENGGRCPAVGKALRNYGLGGCVKYVYHEPCGLNRARNRGTSVASGDIVALLDDDCIPAPDWVAEHRAVHSQFPELGVLGGRVELSFTVPPPSWFRGPFRSFLSEIDWGGGLRELGRSQWVAGGNISFRKSLYDLVGGFRGDLGLAGRQPPYLGNDESEFVARARAVADPGVLYSSRASVRHMIPTRRCEIRYLEQRRLGQGMSDVAWLQLLDPRGYRERAMAKIQRQIKNWCLPGSEPDVIGDPGRTGRDGYRHRLLRCQIALLDGMRAQLDKGNPVAEGGRQEQCQNGRDCAKRLLDQFANDFDRLCDVIEGELNRCDDPASGSPDRILDRLARLRGMCDTITEAEECRVPPGSEASGNAPGYVACGCAGNDMLPVSHPRGIL